MKKKLLLVLSMVAMLVCAFVLTAYAAEPDATGETVTLADGTKCPIWDTEGNGLIWYITSTDDAGVNTYAYVSATDPSVDYYNGWSGGNQMNTVKITVNDTTYDVSSMVVVNISKDVKITSGHRVGNLIDYFAQKAFYNSKTLQYVYLPTIATNLSSEMFKSCTNLKYINFEDLTALTSFGNQALNGCSSLFAGEALDLTNVPLKSIGSHGFTGTKITSVILPSTLESVNGGDMFSGCTNLETVIGLKPLIENGKINSISNYMFNSCKALKNVDGLMENGILIIPEGFTSLGTLSFNECDQIRFVEFPSTINYVGQAAFAWCDNLVLASFDKVDAKIRSAIANGESYTKVTFNNCGTFKGCPKLAVMCVPEGTTDIINRFVAQGCTSLTAFYMPNSVTSLGTNGGGQGPFCDAPSLYFVSESFTVSQCLVDGEIDLTKLKLPAKPAVYFMPESLTTTHGHVQTNQYSKDGTFFRNCNAINDVLVFGENYVDFNARNAFHGMGAKDAPKTVVFLGNITQSVTFKNAQYISFVFANEEDKSPEDLNIIDMEYDQNNTDSYMYFCYDGSRYSYRISKNDMASYTDIADKVAAVMATKTSDSKHVINPNIPVQVVPADCVKNETLSYFCFCGGVVDVVETEGTVLGHAHSVFVDLVYADFSKAGYYSYKCERCDDMNNEKTAPALFTNKGYSAAEYEGGGMSIGFNVDKAAITAYEEATGKTVSYGVFAVLAEKIGANDIFDADGKALDGVIAADITGTGFDIFDLKIIGFTGNQVDIDLAMGAYVGTTKDGKTEYAYLQGGTPETDAKYFFASYTDVKAIVDAKNGVSAQ